MDRQVVFYLMRHGQKARQGYNVELGKIGVEQVLSTIPFFENNKPECIFYSPYLRTQDTANIISQRLEISKISEGLIAERRICGPKTVSSQIYEEEWNKSDRNREYLPFNGEGESSLQSGLRFENALQKIITNTFFSKVLIVSHAGIIYDFLLNKNLIDLCDVSSGERIKFASISTVIYTNGEWRLEEFGRCFYRNE